jgi:hypothetical protein
MGSSRDTFFESPSSMFVVLENICNIYKEIINSVLLKIHLALSCVKLVRSAF